MSELASESLSPSAGPMADGRTVLLCDDQSELRDAIILLLGNFSLFRVVGRATDGVSCLRRIADSRPDIVIMDVSLPGGAVDLVRSARAGHPDLHIVMFPATTRRPCRRTCSPPEPIAT